MICKQIALSVLLLSSLAYAEMQSDYKHISKHYLNLLKNHVVCKTDDLSEQCSECYETTRLLDGEIEKAVVAKESVFFEQSGLIMEVIYQAVQENHIIISPDGLQKAIESVLKINRYQGVDNKLIADKVETLLMVFLREQRDNHKNNSPIVGLKDWLKNRFAIALQAQEAKEYPKKADQNVQKPSPSIRAPILPIPQQAPADNEDED